VRLFAALELPGDARAALTSWAARVSAREPAIRLVPTAALHVTLAFLGEQDEADADAIARAVLAEARPLGELAVTEAAWLPPHRPGVLVADLAEDGERLAALHAALDRALAPWCEPEDRAYRPHVTVARIRRGERISARTVAAPPRLRFVPTAIGLYRSYPSSRYEPIARCPLAGKGR
jgi:2'-5' RNA ligase